MKEEPKKTRIIRDKEGKFKKGHSGNPAGKPEGAYSLLAILKAELQKRPEGEDEKTYAHFIVEKMIKEAKDKGDDQKLKLIFNYIEGMPLQKLANADGSNLPVPILNIPKLCLIKKHQQREK